MGPHLKVTMRTKEQVPKCCPPSRMLVRTKEGSLEHGNHLQGRFEGHFGGLFEGLLQGHFFADSSESRNARASSPLPAAMSASSRSARLLPSIATDASAFWASMMRFVSKHAAFFATLFRNFRYAIHHSDYPQVLRRR